MLTLLVSLPEVGEEILPVVGHEVAYWSIGD
jgi:hypothetical protein